VKEQVAPLVNVILAMEMVLVIAGVAWLLVSSSPSRRKASAAPHPRYGVLLPAVELVSIAAIGLGIGQAITHQPIPDLLTLALLGIGLPAISGMSVAMIMRQETSPLRGVRGWFVLATTIIGSLVLGLFPNAI
jgi:hypothetical protein